MVAAYSSGDAGPGHQCQRGGDVGHLGELNRDGVGDRHGPYGRNGGFWCGLGGRLGCFRLAVGGIGVGRARGDLPGGGVDCRREIGSGDTGIGVRPENDLVFGAAGSRHDCESGEYGSGDADSGPTSAALGVHRGFFLAGLAETVDDSNHGMAPVVGTGRRTHGLGLATHADTSGVRPDDRCGDGRQAGSMREMTSSSDSTYTSPSGPSANAAGEGPVPTPRSMRGGGRRVAVADHTPQLGGAVVGEQVDAIELGNGATAVHDTAGDGAALVVAVLDDRTQVALGRRSGTGERDRPLDQWPAQVDGVGRAGGHHVDLLDGVLADVGDPQVAGRVIEVDPPRVAGAHEVDLRGSTAAHERIRGGNGVGFAAVRVDSQDRSEKSGRVLAVVVFVPRATPVAQRDVQQSVGPELEIAAIVVAGRLIHPQDRTAAVEVDRRAVGVPDGDDAGAVAVGEVDVQLVAGRGELDPQQALLDPVAGETPTQIDELLDDLAGLQVDTGDDART